MAGWTLNTTLEIESRTFLTTSLPCSDTLQAVFPPPYFWLALLHCFQVVGTSNSNVVDNTAGASRVEAIVPAAEISGSGIYANVVNHNPRLRDFSNGCRCDCLRCFHRYQFYPGHHSK